MQQKYKMQVRSLSQEDALEEDTETHPSIPAWRIPQAEEPGGLQSIQSDTPEEAHHTRMVMDVFFFFLFLS